MTGWLAAMAAGGATTLLVVSSPSLGVLLAIAALLLVTTGRARMRRTGGFLVGASLAFCLVARAVDSLCSPLDRCQDLAQSVGMFALWLGVAGLVITAVALARRPTEPSSAISRD